jgi:hypothetical protein
MSRADRSGYINKEIEMQDSTPLDVALHLARCGYAVFPAHVRYVGGKKDVRPRVNWGAATASTPTEAMIRMWWGQWPEAWPTVACRSDLVVVDCDVDKGGPDAWMACVQGVLPEVNLPTSTGGVHHWYSPDPTCDVTNSESAIAPGVDVRGVGGAVFIHPAAWEAVLCLEPGTRLDPVPSVVTDYELSRTSGGQVRTFTAGQARHFTALHAQGPLEGAEEGTINSTLYRSAMVMGHFVPAFMGAAKAEGLLLEWQRTAWVAGGGPDDQDYRGARKTIASAWRVKTWKAVEGTTGAVPDDATGAESGDEGPALNLPAEFWTARPLLADIRRASHAAMVSPDAVLGVIMARIAGMVDHRARVVSSRGPASLNLFVVPIGPSGAGKTQAVRLGRAILPTLERLKNDEGYPDGLPLGSGEGFSEVFMDDVEEGAGEVNKNGTERMRTVRRMVRHNAFLYVDEGESLTQMGSRAGNTTMAALRTAFVADTLGQLNARKETRRVIPEGTYATGVVLGFQVMTIAPLMEDVGSGTAQRLLYSWALDPTIPEMSDAVDLVAENLVTVLESTHSGPGVMLRVPPEADAELRRITLLRNRGESEEPESDNHRPLMMMKVAALLALLDGSRVDLQMTMGDWELARLVWGTSCAVRDHVAGLVAAERVREAEARAEATVRVAARSEVAKVEALDGRELKIVQGVAARIRTLAAKGGGAVSRSVVRRGVDGTRRGVVDQAAEYAEAEGWLRIEPPEGRDGVVFRVVG